MWIFIDDNCNLRMSHWPLHCQPATCNFCPASSAEKQFCCAWFCHNFQRRYGPFKFSQLRIPRQYIYRLQHFSSKTLTNLLCKAKNGISSKDEIEWRENKLLMQKLLAHHLWNINTKKNCKKWRPNSNDVSRIKKSIFVSEFAVKWMSELVRIKCTKKNNEWKKNGR